MAPYRHQPCDDYMKSLLLAYDPRMRARGDYLLDVAMRHSTNRFMGRSL